jgi:hypothetical protein
MKNVPSLAGDATHIPPFFVQVSSHPATGIGPLVAGILPQGLKSSPPHALVHAASWKKFCVTQFTLPAVHACATWVAKFSRSNLRVQLFAGIFESFTFSRTGSRESEEAENPEAKRGKPIACAGLIGAAGPIPASRRGAATEGDNLHRQGRGNYIAANSWDILALFLFLGEAGCGHSLQQSSGSLPRAFSRSWLSITSWLSGFRNDRQHQGSLLMGHVMPKSRHAKIVFGVAFGYTSTAFREHTLQAQRGTLLRRAISNLCLRTRHWALARSCRS